jgi:hypothetical protein
LLIITALAVYPLLVGSHVSELQEPTYTPEEDWSETATSTQPDSEESPSTPEEVIPEVVVVPTPAPVKAKPMAISPDEEYVVDKILETFPEAPIMVEVARCESGLDPHADRITHDGRTGIDVGLFQINQIHLKKLNELGLDRYDLYDNLTYAKMLYDARGLGDWYMSRHCWG